VAYKGGAAENQRRRNLLARARGFRSFNQYRETIKGRPAPAPARVQFGGGVEYVNTRDEGRLRAAFMRAERIEASLTARVTVLVNPGDGSHPRTWREADVELWEDGGWRAVLAAQAVRNQRGGFAFAMIANAIANIVSGRSAVGANPAILSVLLRVE
jgi:hypothetical protein